MAWLDITFGDGHTIEYPLTDEAVVLGRDPSCDIPLDDANTSRRHARIRLDGDTYVVEDLGSKNGTLVNDVRSPRGALANGDEIRIGSIYIRLRTKPRSASEGTVVLSDTTPRAENACFSSRKVPVMVPQNRLERLYELSERLTRLRGRNELLDDVMDICFDMLRFERGAIALRRRDDRGVDWPVVRNLIGPGGELTISRSILGRALDHGERAVINDTADEDVDPSVSIVQHGIRSALCVPLMIGDEVLGVIYGDRVTTGTRYSAEDVDFLAALARQVTIGLVNCHLMEEQKRKVQLENEIGLARDIQRRLFPDPLPRRDDLQVAALNEPGRHVSGDYFDVVELGDGSVGVLIADVTGEGIAAALLMANLQAAVRVTLAVARDLGDLLTGWNALIYSNTDASKFVTCLVMLIHPERRTLTLASAGHHMPIMMAGDPVRRTELAVEPGYPLGVMADAAYETRTIEWGPGPCALFCYTDGVIEAMNNHGEQFAEARMLEVLDEHGDCPPQDLLTHMRRSVTGFCAGAPQSDDITMVAVRLP